MELTPALAMVNVVNPMSGCDCEGFFQIYFCFENKEMCYFVNSAHDERHTHFGKISLRQIKL